MEFFLVYFLLLFTTFHGIVSAWCLWGVFIGTFACLLFLFGSNICFGLHHVLFIFDWDEKVVGREKRKRKRAGEKRGAWSRGGMGLDFGVSG